MDGPELEICRDWINEGAARAMDDFERFYADSLTILSEPSLRETKARPPAATARSASTAAPGSLSARGPTSRKSLRATACRS